MITQKLLLLGAHSGSGSVITAVPAFIEHLLWAPCHCCHCSLGQQELMEA